MLAKPNQDEIITFSSIIENLVKEKNIPYIEAVLLHCDRQGFEYDVVPKLISETLKAKLQREAESIHLLVKSDVNALPFE